MKEEWWGEGPSLKQLGNPHRALFPKERFKGKRKEKILQGEEGSRMEPDNGQWSSGRKQKP